MASSAVVDGLSRTEMPAVDSIADAQTNDRSRHDIAQVVAMVSDARPAGAGCGAMGTR